MKPVFHQAKWIWTKSSLTHDDYASFQVEVSTKEEAVNLRISADSFYALYVNDKLIRFMGCSDYPWYRYYDEIPLLLNSGHNRIRIDVWHIGDPFQTYYPSSHGVIFELLSGEKVLAYSSSKTPSRVMKEYQNGLRKKITTQLGYSFCYDANQKPTVFHPSITVRKSLLCFHKRDIHPLILEERKPVHTEKLTDSVLVDLGEETAGLIDLDFISPISQQITIAFGEHINDGHVRRIIADRDFSFTYIAKKGENQYLNPLRRIAGRYLEIFASSPIDIHYVGIRPVRYEHEIIPKTFKDPLFNQIYQICIHTLECCMHEHYEDCPWREQALYAQDARNQMLCGYEVFKGTEYQKHNLLLIAKDHNPTGLLNLCYPMKYNGLSIPMFSLFYLLEVKEYLDHTGDTLLFKKVKPVLHRIADVFSKRIDEHHLIPYFPKPFWNFYEWTPGSSNDDIFNPDSPESKDQYDLILNAFYVYVMERYTKMTGKTQNLEEMKKAIVTTFYDENEHLFRMNSKSSSFSQFGNALALLIGLGDVITLEKVKKEEHMVRASLSTRGFVYDAILAKDKSGADFILKDIRDIYGKMLKTGATATYETEKGADDFNKAGSLCHGWSALPIYYLNLLIK